MRCSVQCCRTENRANKTGKDLQNTHYSTCRSAESLIYQPPSECKRNTLLIATLLCPADKAQEEVNPSRNQEEEERTTSTSSTTTTKGRSRGASAGQIRAFSQGPVTCQTCRMTFDVRRYVCVHLSRSLHPFQCAACDQDFVSKYELCRHGKHCGGALPVRCSHCNITFSQQSSLRDHVRAKHSGQEYCCPCGARFRWRPSFNRHRKSCSSSRSKRSQPAL